jgi:ABC-type multidrug transport system ATPase subunit
VSESVVTVDGLGRRFGETVVLEDVSFDVPEGEVVALIGPNGSGKTTLCRVVAGLLEPTDGSVERPIEAEREVGYLPQEPTFRPRFTVRETLDYYGDLVRADVDVDGLLARVGLADAADRPVEALSGGMTRLLGVAQATVGDPPLLVLDEPTSGLDPEMADRIFDILQSLRDDDRSVLVATHDLPGVEAVADDVVLLDEGRVVASDDPAALRARVETDTLRAAFPRLVGREGVATVQTGRRREA